MKKICLLIVLLLVFQYLFPQTFTEQKEISLEGISASSVAWGDYDNDGDLDILLTGYTNSNIIISKIYRNNGNNSFTDQTDISLQPVREGSVAWGDYDNDGYLDILLTGYNDDLRSYHSIIYKNNGNNTFTEQAGISLTGVFNGSVSWGDFDNDGDLDILLTGIEKIDNFSGSNVAKIYRNDGNCTFIEQAGFLIRGFSNSGFSWHDYDNDGDIDILWVIGGYLSIFLNNGDKTFTRQHEISLMGVNSESFDWGDYDNDGDLDILLIGSVSTSTGSSGVSKIFRNDGNNTFSEPADLSLDGVSWGSVTWSDYDNDGYLDILVTGANTSGIECKIYRNNHNNTFTENKENTIVGVTSSSVAWGDYDNDSDLDLLLTGGTSSSYVAKIFSNDVKIANSLPNAPGNLKQVVENNSVLFTWDKATDKETPQNGLSYNLIIQSNDGAIIKNPMSDINSGIRKIVGIGNVGQNNFWTIKDLPKGKYKWSVQAIDHNYSGSKFALFETFEITTADIKEIKNHIGLVETYPNPLSHNLVIRSTDCGNTIDYEILDILGKVYQKGDFIGETVVQTGGMLSGIYFLKVYNGKATEMVRIIKE
jgi:predicted nucleotidyltransferase